MMKIEILLAVGKEEYATKIAELVYGFKTSVELNHIKSLEEFEHQASKRAAGLAIIDYNCDFVSAEEVFTVINKHKLTLPVVYFSENFDSASIVHVIKLGAEDFFTLNETNRLKNIFERKFFGKILSLDQSIATNNEIQQAPIGSIYDSRKEEKDISSIHRDFRKGEVLFKRLFDYSPVSIAISSVPDGKLIEINKSFLDMLGYSNREVLGKNAIEEGHWVNHQDRIEMLDEAIKVGYSKNREVQFKTIDGKIRTALISVEYLKFEDEELSIFMANDITEIIQALKEKQLAQDIQMELSSLKSKFISMISHEFRTPLAAIMLSSDLLKRYGNHWSEEERNKHFKRIQDTILRMTQSMERVLVFGRIEAGQFEISLESLDLAAFCSSIADDIRFNYGDQPEIIVNLNGDSSFARVDENLLGLIISNLLSNAIKYSPKDSKILLEVSCNEEFTKFKVEDQGIGIPESDLPHLFKSFFRASNVGSVSGYGLGLSIVNKCVEAHHGTIDVKSKYGKGTTFTITLPIEANEEDVPKYAC